MNESTYCYKAQGGKKTRISKAMYEKKTGNQISQPECEMICRGKKNVGCMKRCLKY